MLIIHHSDADGRCSAAIILYWMKNNQQPKINESDERVELIEMEYKDKCPLDKILPDEDVWIVDFSFKPEDMKKILEKTERIVWCDHHVSCKDYDYGVNLRGIRDFTEKGKAGCECTWNFFFPEAHVPLGITLLGDYDAWRLKYTPTTFEFYEGLKLQDQNPRSPLWEHIFIDHYDHSAPNILLPICHFVYDIVKEGKTAVKYRDNICADLRSAYGYETEIDGHSAYALNIRGFGSKAFGSIFGKFPICIAYIHDGKEYVVSLYSETVDVSKIAEKYGGGGHKEASGFNCKELPFSRKER